MQLSWLTWHDTEGPASKEALPFVLSEVFDKVLPEMLGNSIYF